MRAKLAYKRLIGKGKGLFADLSPADRRSDSLGGLSGNQLVRGGDPRGGVWGSGATRGRHYIRSPEWPTPWTSARLPAMPSVRLGGLSGMAFL